jgi:PIN domain nuclease of toxin-antitoxin system
MWLLDTHLVLWSAFEPDRLSARAAKLLRSRDKPIAFSLATIWEAAINTSLQRPDFAVDPGRLRLALLAEGFNELPIQPAHVVRVVMPVLAPTAPHRVAPDVPWALMLPLPMAVTNLQRPLAPMPINPPLSASAR